MGRRRGTRKFLRPRVTIARGLLRPPLVMGLLLQVPAARDYERSQDLRVRGASFSSCKFFVMGSRLFGNLIFTTAYPLFGGFAVCIDPGVP